MWNNLFTEEMINKEENLQLYLKNQQLAFKILSADRGSFIMEGQFLQILAAELDLLYTDVIHLRLSEDKIVELVTKHLKANGKTLGPVKADLDDDDFDWYPSDDLKKATVRDDGNLWIIHQNDADPKPSNPHAHNYEDNLKLDLYNGNLFRKTKLVGKLKAKELAALVEKIKRLYPAIKFAPNN